MSVEEDIGGLKADMATVKGQTSKIFEAVNGMAVALADHTARSDGRLVVLEERDGGFKDQIGDIETRVDVVEKTQSNAKWYFLGMGGGGILGGATLLEIIRGIIKGGG